MKDFTYLETVGCKEEVGTKTEKHQTKENTDNMI